MFKICEWRQDIMFLSVLIFKPVARWSVAKKEWREYERREVFMGVRSVITNTSIVDSIHLMEYMGALRFF
jgi:hypothetical protein